MLSLSAKITIFSKKTWTLHKIESCEIVRDIENVTAKCTITVPKRIRWFNEPAIPIKRGDRIVVELGYDLNYEIAFTGYITKITAKTPVKIECEDEMYNLKNTAVKKKSYSNTDLQTILSEQCPAGLNIEVFGTQTIGKYVANFDTVAQLLGDLKENGFTFFFKHGTLYGGMMFDYNEKLGGKKQVFQDGEFGNIIDDENLLWTDAENMQLRVKAISNSTSGKKKLSVELGDKEGNLETINMINATKEELEKRAKKHLTERKSSGFVGSFKTFGVKLVWLLDLIKIKTADRPEGGVYKVQRNKITFGNGYQQEIKIGGKIQ